MISIYAKTLFSRVVITLLPQSGVLGNYLLIYEQCIVYISDINFSLVMATVTRLWLNKDLQMHPL